MVLGVILAGGQSRRMGGGDKFLLSLSGRSILDHVISRLTDQVDMIAINSNSDPQLLSPYKLPIIRDETPAFLGPLAGVLAGMDWGAEKGARYIVTVAADSPFYPKKMVRTFQNKLNGTQVQLAMATSYKQKNNVSYHPTFGLWPVELRDDLRAELAKGTRKVLDWTKRHSCVDVAFNIGVYDPFFNINTVADLAEAERIYQENFI